jgi:2,3-bisphosphoglycerate-independent phosphoglycerate mutase
VDLGLGRLLKSVEKVQGIALITADHGNSEDMFETDKKGNLLRDENGQPKPKTSHSLNPVPFIIYDPGFQGEYVLSEKTKAGLSNIAATCIRLLGYIPPEDYDPSLIEFV